MKKAIEAIIYITMIVATVVFSLSPHIEKHILVAADDHDSEYPTTKGLYKIQELVERATGGEITVKVFPSAQLGSEKETIELTQMGIIDINRVSCSAMVAFSPSMGVLSLPYIFKSWEHEWTVMDGPIGRRLGQSLESVGLMTLAYYDSGARSFYNKSRPVNSPADLKGLKIRVQGNPVMIDLVEALGGSATPMAFEEVYSAIQTGVIEGAENNPPSYETTGHYEVAKFYSLDEHSRIPEIVLFSKKVWDTMSDEHRKAVTHAAKDSEEYQKRQWREEEEKAMKTVRAAGCKINTPDKTPFATAVRPLYKKYAGSLGGLINEIQAVE